MTPRAEHLPLSLQDGLVELILRRVNEGRGALGMRELMRSELSGRCIPNHCHQCAIGTAFQPRRFSVVADSLSPDEISEAEAMAIAWRTRVFGGWVALPHDLAVAAAAFDSGQLPELMNHHRQFAPDSAFREDAVSVAAARSVIEPVS